MRRSKNQWDQKHGIWQPRISEEMVLKEIVERLWLQARIKVWRIRERIPGMCSRRSLSTPGIPDLVGWIPRNFPRTFESKMGTMTHHGYPAAPLFIEVKRPGGARRPAQETFIAEALDGGCIAFFSESWHDVVVEFGKFGIELKEN